MVEISCSKLDIPIILISTWYICLNYMYIHVIIVSHRSVLAEYKGSNWNIVLMVKNVTFICDALINNKSVKCINLNALKQFTHVTKCPRTCVEMLSVCVCVCVCVCGGGLTLTEECKKEEVRGSEPYFIQYWF